VLREKSVQSQNRRAVRVKSQEVEKAREIAGSCWPSEILVEANLSVSINENHRSAMIDCDQQQQRKGIK